MASGASDFLRKPFTVETLRGAMNAALAGRTRAGDENAASPTPSAFDRANINEFCLSSSPGVTHHRDGGLKDVFSVTGAGGETHVCRVELPPYVAELARAHADRDTFPGGDAFWQALCGEALANHLWQNAEPPPGNVLRVEDLTTGLRHWLDAVLARAAND